MELELLIAAVSRAGGELREQLGQLTAAGQMLEQLLTGEKERGCLAVISHSVCRMLRTVYRTELARRLTDENEIRTFPRELDMKSWLEAVGGRAGSLLRHAGVELTVICLGGLVNCADPELLEYAVLELLTHGGEKTELAVSAEGQSMILSVSGGMMPDAEDEGMELVRTILELHGGSLTLSEENGFTARAALPFRDPRMADRMNSPYTVWNSGGFDPALVALCDRIPTEYFMPEDHK